MQTGLSLTSNLPECDSWFAHIPLLFGYMFKPYTNTTFQRKWNDIVTCWNIIKIIEYTISLETQGWQHPNVS